MWENTAPGIEFPCVFCAGVVLCCFCFLLFFFIVHMLKTFPTLNVSRSLQL